MYNGVHSYFESAAFMSKARGTKNRDTLDRVRRATWLCSEIEVGSGGRRAPELERTLVNNEIKVGSGGRRASQPERKLSGKKHEDDIHRNVGRKWRRWEAGQAGMSDVDFHKIARAAIELGWLDASRAAEAGFSTKFAEVAQMSAGKASQVHKEKLEELRTFARAKEHLLAALGHFATTCSGLKRAGLIDLGESDLNALEEEQNLLSEHDRDLLRRLKQDAVFAMLPDPQVLRAQLARLELCFPNTGQLPHSKPRGLTRHSSRRYQANFELTDTVKGDDSSIFSNYAGFAGLAELSKKRKLLAQKRRLTRLQSLTSKKTLQW